MTSTSFQSLPIVDIGGLRSGDPAALERIAAELGKVAHEVGFCYLTDTGIPEEVFERLLDAAKAFFALPLEEKMALYIGNSTCHRGFVPRGEEGYTAAVQDLKEAFDTALDLPADDPDHVAGNPMLGPNVWPDLPEFAEAVTEYYRYAMKVGDQLFRAFAVALGEAPEFFEPVTRRSPSQLRLMHYPFDPHAVDVPGMGSHTDFECFTLLRPTAPALEVMNGDGQWIDAPPLPGTLVMNIGDMLEAWTNGYFVATSHRVRNVQEERYSFPLFVNVDYDTVIEPLARFRGPGAPLRPPIHAGEHLYAQTIHAFRYLRERMDAGLVALPEGSVGVNEFGQQARHSASMA